MGTTAASPPREDRRAGRPHRRWPAHLRKRAIPGHNWGRRDDQPRSRLHHTSRWAASRVRPLAGRIRLRADHRHLLLLRRGHPAGVEPLVLRRGDVLLSTGRIGRAGTPATTILGGTSLVTTVPDPERCVERCWPTTRHAQRSLTPMRSRSITTARRRRTGPTNLPSRSPSTHGFRALGQPRAAFNRPFSRSSSFKRLMSSAFVPPYWLRQR